LARARCEGGCAFCANRLSDPARFLGTGPPAQPPTTRMWSRQCWTPPRAHRARTACSPSRRAADAGGGACSAFRNCAHARRLPLPRRTAAGGRRLRRPGQEEDLPGALCALLRGHIAQGARPLTLFAFCPFLSRRLRLLFAQRTHAGAPAPHPLRQNFTIMGFARSKMTQQEFRDMISLTLSCRIDQRCAFCVTHPAAQLPSLTRPARLARAARRAARSRRSSSSGASTRLGSTMPRRRLTSCRRSCPSTRWAAPPTASSTCPSRPPCSSRLRRTRRAAPPPPQVRRSTLGSAARAPSATSAHERVRLRARRASGYTRVIVEKPFGRDLESSRELGRGLAEALTEEQIYRCASKRCPRLRCDVRCMLTCLPCIFGVAASITIWARS
jgi:hypothetical protein